jgi:hypothetical protein
MRDLNHADVGIGQHGCGAGIVNFHDHCRHIEKTSRSIVSASLPSKAISTRYKALLQRCWRVGILREFGAKGFRFSCWERIMPFKILWGGG